MKKLLFALALLVSTPAFAVTTQSLLPDFNPGDSLVITAYDTDANDFVWFARLTSNPVPTFDIFSNTTFDGQTLYQHLAGYAPASHTHQITDVQGLTSALGGKASITHSHAYGDLTGLPDLSLYATNSTMNAYLSDKVDKITGKGLSTEDYTSAEKAKLSGIASGATANDTDANLKNRANHTGSQAISTVTGLQTALNSKFELPAGGTTSQVIRGDGTLGSLSGPANTDALSEGSTNKYFTDARAQAASKMVSGTTVKTGAFPVIKSATVASGVAVYHFTTDGTSGGSALCPNGVDQDSIQVTVNNPNSSYQYGWAFSNSNKTLTVTVNSFTTASLLTGVLGQSPANGAVVKMLAFCN